MDELLEIALWIMALHHGEPDESAAREFRDQVIMWNFFLPHRLVDIGPYAELLREAGRLEASLHSAYVCHELQTVVSTASLPRLA